MRLPRPQFEAVDEDFRPEKAGFGAESALFCFQTHGLPKAHYYETLGALHPEVLAQIEASHVRVRNDVIWRPSVRTWPL